LLACGTREERRQPVYNGGPASRLSWLHRFAAAVALFGAAIAGGCSFVLDSTAETSDAGALQTGSIASGGKSGSAADAVRPSEMDLAYARVAAADAITRAANGSTVPWENPNTGAGGNITVLAAFHNESGFSCRDFLASYVHGQSQTWLQGEACRTAYGKWKVKSLKTLRD
jgi:surface antigen